MEIHGLREEELLIRRLEGYQASDQYPFHMPGHKRLKQGGEGLGFPDPFSIDITEIQGFDNLHHPEGILKRSMEWAAGLYGADETRYLVNGSSSGILSAICGCVKRGGKLLMSRNCHKSVYHGAYLHQLKTVYVYPQTVPGLGIQGGIPAQDVEKELSREGNEDIQAVLIVSPTYDGVVSDIKRIAEAVHQAGIPLIVDEAHGAHFRYGTEFPQSALELGADVVIQSVHKTMPSLTQTALLHMKANRPGGGFYMDPGAVRRYLSIYQSSSPSYVLMAGIENSIFRMEQMREKTREYMQELEEMRGRLASMKCLCLADRGLVGSSGIFDLDRTKIVVSTRGTSLTGETLMELLRSRYHLEMEMCGADYVTAISTVMDSKEGLLRLERALLEIDEECRKWGIEEPGKAVLKEPSCVYSRKNQVKLTLAEALDGLGRRIGLKEAVGEISGEFVYIYPPGIPILAPGEVISRETVELILDYKAKGLPVQGPEDESLGAIKVVENEKKRKE